MSAALTLITCGPGVAAASGNAAIASPLHAATADELNAAAHNGDSEFVLFVDAESESPEELAIPQHPHLAGACLFAAQDGLDDGDPACAWLRLFDPARSVPVKALVRRADVAADGFADVDHPLQEWFVRQLVGGRSVDVRLWAGNGGSSVDPTALPKLRPAEPGRRSRWLPDAVERLDLRSVHPGINASTEATALKAGLLQINDFLDASHRCSQSVQGRGVNSAGDYWHAIMHRREPDYSNAKYWFRAVGGHPVFAELAEQAAMLLDAHPAIAERWRGRLLPGGDWDPFAFVDLCAACPQAEDDVLSLFARRMQWIEMQLLLRQTLRDAGGL